MNKKLLIIFLFFGFNLNVESKIDLKKMVNEVKSKIQKAPAKAAAIALGTIGTVAGIASIISNKTKPEELTYFHDKLLNTIAETNVEGKVNEFKTLSKAQRELKLGDVLLFEVNETQSQEDLKKNLVKITCKNEQDKDKKDLYLSLKTKMVVQLKDNKTVPMNFAKDSEPKKTYIVKTLSELPDPITPSNSTHWSRNKNRYFVAGGVLTTAAVGGLGYYYRIHLPVAAADSAEKARVEAARQVAEAECNNKPGSDECINALKKVETLCPAGSKNYSCVGVKENLDNNQQLSAERDRNISFQKKEVEDECGGNDIENFHGDFEGKCFSAIFKLKEFDCSRGHEKSIECVKAEESISSFIIKEDDTPLPTPVPVVALVADAAGADGASANVDVECSEPYSNGCLSARKNLTNICDTITLKPLSCDHAHKKFLNAKIDRNNLIEKIKATESEVKLYCPKSNLKNCLDSYKKLKRLCPPRSTRPSCANVDLGIVATETLIENARLLTAKEAAERDAERNKIIAVKSHCDLSRNNLTIDNRNTLTIDCENAIKNADLDKKKHFQKLSRLFHPDLAITESKKKQHLEIMQIINALRDELKKPKCFSRD